MSGSPALKRLGQIGAQFGGGNAGDEGDVRHTIGRDLITAAPADDGRMRQTKRPAQGIDAAGCCDGALDRVFVHSASRSMRLRPIASGFVASCNSRRALARHDLGMTEKLDTLHQRIAWAVARFEGTHQEIATAVGVQRPMISLWCKGTRTPELGNLLALADVLGVSAAWLLSGDRLALRDAGEADFMDLFRDLTDEKRATVCEITKAFRPKDAA
jgi:transcriptional regulator with XRE-family HTH domain